MQDDDQERATDRELLWRAIKLVGRSFGPQCLRKFRCELKLQRSR
jgi:hypothetical protein